MRGSEHPPLYSNLTWFGGQKKLLGQQWVAVRASGAVGSLVGIARQRVPRFRAVFFCPLTAGSPRLRDTGHEVLPHCVLQHGALQRPEKTLLFLPPDLPMPGRMEAHVMAPSCARESADADSPATNASAAAWASRRG